MQTCAIHSETTASGMKIECISVRPHEPVRFIMERQYED